MKSISTRFAVFCFALLFFGCTNTDKEQSVVNADSTGNKTSIGKHNAEAVPFTGYWVNEIYVNSLLKTKSPSRTTIPEMSSIWIPGSTHQKTNMGYSFHEAGEDIMVLKKDAGWELWDTAAKNKRGVIEIISAGKIKIDTATFVRLNNYDQNENQFNPPVVEKLLFEGNYVSDKGNPVVVHANGSIIGFVPFISFTTPVDYFDQGMQVDQLTLMKADSSSEKMAFRFKDDKLLLYELKCTNYDSTYKICAEVRFGKLLHTLTKKQ